MDEIGQDAETESLHFSLPMLKKETPVKPRSSMGGLPPVPATTKSTSRLGGCLLSQNCQRYSNTFSVQVDSLRINPEYSLSLKSRIGTPELGALAGR